jgi:hypothetical protein
MLYRVMQDPAYNSLTIAKQLERAFYGRLSSAGFDSEQATRGRRLADLWDETWKFTPYLEDTEPHPSGLGELAMLGGRLIGATTSVAKLRLQELLGGAAEVLPARSDRNTDLWVFNVMKAVDRDAVETLDESAVFRVNPVKSDVLCGLGFKSSIEASRLRGLHFREVGPRDRVRII